MHARVHSRWAENFLRLASEKLPASDAVNDPARAVTVELVFGADGQVVSLETVQSAGVAGFDDAAKEVLRDSVPFPWADADLRSDDGLVHLRWTFARDQRRCSGMTLLHFEEPLAIALPKLIRDGREEEALRRMRVARAAGTPIDPMMTTLASAWIKAAVGHPNATVAAAEMLATLGDSAGTTWLKAAVKRPETALAAGRALAARHVPICPLVGSMLGSVAVPAPASASAGGAKPAAPAKPPTPAEQLTAASALATAGETECAPGLIALLEDHKAHTDTRVAAAVALGAIASDDATKKALAGAGKDDVVAVRAAATLAGARPGSGRSKVFALVPPLRDPSPEMRAAAAAGIVRAGGDSNLADLYVIFTDKDPRPLGRGRDRARSPAHRRGDEAAGPPAQALGAAGAAGGSARAGRSRRARFLRARCARSWTPRSTPSCTGWRWSPPTRRPSTTWRRWSPPATPATPRWRAWRSPPTARAWRAPSATRPATVLARGAARSCPRRSAPTRWPNGWPAASATLQRRPRAPPATDRPRAAVEPR